MSRTTLSSRRQFLSTSSRMALGGACALATLGRMQLAQAATQPGDYRALVCLFLFGGNDSFNMIVPRGLAEHNAYSAARPNLIIPRDALLPLSPTAGSAGVEWGLHPSMPELGGLFEQGRAALLANVGPLMAPTTAADYRNNRVPLPPELFSHIDQQAYAMSFGSEVEAKPGWGGRMADRLTQRFAANSPVGSLPLSLSLAGSNAWQNGSSGGLYTLGSTGVTRLDVTLRTSPSARWTTRRNAFNALIEAGTLESATFVREYARSTKTARDFAESVNAAVEQVALSTAFPSSTLGQSLRTVARVIGARHTLSQTRQVFFVSLGGWDMHDNMLADHQTLLSTVSQALAAFYQSTVELGLSEKVTSFTMTDFGRTLNNNGDGTDHGWGGHSWVLGGDVVGRRFYGQMPEYALGNSQDAGRGRMVPTTSVEQLGSTMARWMGLSHGDAREIFPNLDAFDSAANYLPMLASTNQQLNDIGFTRQRSKGP